MRSSAGDEICDCPPGYYGYQCEKTYRCEAGCAHDQTCVWGPGMMEADCKGDCDMGGPGCAPPIHTAGDIN